jgi:cytochrome c2
MKSAIFTAVMIAAVVLGATRLGLAQDAKAQQGAALFSAQKCTMCHSVAGKGNPKGPLDPTSVKTDNAAADAER